MKDFKLYLQGLGWAALGGIVCLVFLASVIGMFYGFYARANPEGVFIISGPDIRDITMQVSQELFWLDVSVVHGSIDFVDESATSFCIGVCRQYLFNGNVEVLVDGAGVKIILADGWSFTRVKG